VSILRYSLWNDKLECYTDYEMDEFVKSVSFVSLDNAWPELLAAARANHIFFTSQWQTAWWHVFGGDYNLVLLAIADGAEIAGIAPFKRKDGKLSFIGSTDVCDYMDFIVRNGREDYVFSLLLDYLEKQEWNSIELENVLPNSLVLKFFVPLAQRRGYQIELKQTNVSPQLILPASWDDYLASLTTKDRHEIRRKLRRLEQNQSVNYSAVTAKELFPQAAEGFFTLFQLSIAEKANFMTGKKKEFFTTMISRLAEYGNIRLSFMEVDGKLVSSTLCFDYNDDIYLYNSAYDKEYSALSVSLLLEVYNIRDAISNGKKRFDFLSGNEPYKYDLGGQDVPLNRCVISRR
jgi:CelD/BcsL family acetyltransferase involved in cellulose biosynthesis